MVSLASFDIAIVVAAESRFKTLAELLAFAKANPGKLNIGSINIGSTQNLVAELLKSSSGADLQIVPFNGTPAVVTALRGGQIDAAVNHPDVKKKLHELHVEAQSGTPEQASELLASEIRRWGEVIQRVKIPTQ